MNKIIYISQAFFPANPNDQAETIFVLNMCSALSKLTEQLTLFFPTRSYTKNLEASLSNTLNKDYGITLSFKVFPIHWPKTKGAALVYSIIAYSKYIRKIDNGKTLVYFRCMYSALIFSLLNKKTPFAYETHALPRTQFHEKIEKLFFNSKNCKKIILITNALKKSYIEKYNSSKYNNKYFIVPDGINSNLLTPPGSSLRHSTSDRPNVVYTGSLQSGKGMEIITKLAKKMPDVDFTIVGGTTEEVAKYKELHIKNLYLVGHVNANDAVRYQHGSDVLILPNQPSVLCDNGRVDIGAWTSPMKLFEYMATGKPIIASDLDVLKEVLTDKVNCLLANPVDPNSWVDSIRMILEDPSLAQSLASNAFEEVKSKYTWDARAQKILEAVEIDT